MLWEVLLRAFRYVKYISNEGDKEKSLGCWFFYHQGGGYLKFLVDNHRIPRNIKIVSDTDGGEQEVLHRDSL